MFRRQPPSARIYLCLLALALCSLPSLAKKKPPAHPININTAGATELQQVPGIGLKKLEKIRKYLTVGKPPSKKQSSSSQTASAPAKSQTAQSPAKQSTTPPAIASEDEEP